MMHVLGIDVGTSACRACVLDSGKRIVASARTPLPPPRQRAAAVDQDPELWWQALLQTLDRLGRQPATLRIRRIALDATSATLLLCDHQGRPLTPGLLYNDSRAVTEAAQIARVAPPDSPARGAGSSLAKLLWLRRSLQRRDYLALHQADWLAGRLCGHFGFSDENNALKMGYDPLARRWPDWLRRLDVGEQQLPRVRPPGTPVGTLDPELARRWRWQSPVEVVAGTTDSTAGFIATGADQPGTAVTSLGSTLVLKVLSRRPVFAADYGVYSHRLGDRWLVGGASNAGGSVLRRLFGPCDIHRYARLMKPEQPTGLDYYPLATAGERFPINDPQLQPRLEPRPGSDAVFFQAILEGLARIEQQGYRLLTELGAPRPQRVLSVGGGAGNRDWTRIRRQLLGVPVEAAPQQEAAYGAALLARGYGG
ncbi:MAG TPA: carbohydrate kinase [Gammaproteobacteria bacterium]|nr:carbohydrate kinase [Gammaproteobacteria bacterium]